MRWRLIILLFSISIPTTYSLMNLSHLASQIPLPSGITNLEGILTTKAITTSILSHLRLELTADKFVLQLTQFNYHSTDYFYISIFITYLYGQYRYFKGSENCQIDERLGKFDKYQKINRITREVLFILFVIFTKDVQNAI